MNDFTLPTGPIAQSNTSSTGPIKPKWFFTEDELRRSPSCLKGISTMEEQRYIQSGCLFIRTIADRLNEMQPEGKISQLCICVSMVHLKRFFVVHTLKDFDARDVGAAVLFLTSKSEECPKRLEYIVRTWYKLRVEHEVHQKEVDRTAVINKETYHKLVEYIVWIENIVLQTIGFNFAIDIPHPFVLRAKDLFRKNDNKFAEFVFWLTTDM
uniref:Cyclin N-terminal domain-containing protein n=1 Tax=Bursaphelenchus xylophilus TaxID=6326 RepID=A0A1I7RU39_BURXY